MGGGVCFGKGSKVVSWETPSLKRELDTLNNPSRYPSKPKTLQHYPKAPENLPWDPSTQILPTLGPKVCNHYLHWAIWSLRAIAQGPDSCSTAAFDSRGPHQVGRPPCTIIGAICKGSSCGGISIDMVVSQNKGTPI